MNNRSPSETSSNRRLRRRPIDIEKYIHKLPSINRLGTFSGEGCYQFPDGLNVPTLPPESSYWYRFYEKIGYNNYTTENVAKRLDRKISKLHSYFERLEMGELTKREMDKRQPNNFFGPYFPTPAEIKKLAHTEIKIDWELMPSHASLTSTNRLKNFGRKDIEILIARWQEFQETYKIYDLRPLMGIRCGAVHKYNENEFIFFRLINHKTYKQFLEYMGKNLPNIALCSIEQKLRTLCDNFIDGSYVTQKKPLPMTGLELRLMEEIVKRYGYKSFKIMELLIGTRVASKFYHFFVRYLAILHLPIRCGNWTKDEDFKLINNLYSAFQTTQESGFLTAKWKPCWIDIFNNIKTRTVLMLGDRWKKLKQGILECENEPSELEWTSEDTIKLICEVYNSGADNVNGVNWHEITEKFPTCTRNTLRTKFNFIYKTRIPSRYKRYFDEALEYLYHRVTPVYKLKNIRHCKRKKDLGHLLEWKKMAEDEIGSLINFFTEEELEDYDEDYQLLSEGMSHDPSRSFISERDTLEPTSSQVFSQATVTSREESLQGTSTKRKITKNKNSSRKKSSGSVSEVSKRKRTRSKERHSKRRKLEEDCQIDGLNALVLETSSEKKKKKKRRRMGKGEIEIDSLGGRGKGEIEIDSSCGRGTTNATDRTSVAVNREIEFGNRVKEKRKKEKAKKCLERAEEEPDLNVRYMKKKHRSKTHSYFDTGGRTYCSV